MYYKAYKMNDHDWVAAISPEEACDFYASEIGAPIEEVRDHFEGEEVANATFHYDCPGKPLRRVRVDELIELVMSEDREVAGGPVLEEGSAFLLASLEH